MTTNDDASSHGTRLVQIGDASSDFFVHAIGCDPQRFIRLFRQAVSRIPSTVCAALTVHWTPVGPTSPHIGLVSQPVILDDSGRHAALAITDNNGCRLRFAEPAIRAIPDALGRCLVAHELAHVHAIAESNLGTLHPKERIAYTDAQGSTDEFRQTLEDYADARASVWGFDPAGLRQWTAEYLRGLST